MAVLQLVVQKQTSTAEIQAILGGAVNTRLDRAGAEVFLTDVTCRVPTLKLVG